MAAEHSIGVHALDQPPLLASALAHVAPELRLGFVLMDEVTRAMQTHVPDLPPDMLDLLAGIARAPLDEIAYQLRTIPGPAGAPPLSIYVINAQPGTNRPAILHMHGGGFTGGSAQMDLRLLQEIARDIDCVAISVEYRLAPAATYTDSVEDNYAALLWLADNAATLGVDKSRMAVMGESAGGAHAALLAATARTRGKVTIAFQALIYPMLDDRTGLVAGHQDPVWVAGWTSEGNRAAWSAFLGQPAGGADVPARAVPARMNDLTGSPPTWIGVGAIDLLAGEGIGFAQRLIGAGVAVELYVIPGAFHGFDIWAPHTEAARRFRVEVTEALRRGLKP